MTEQAIQPFDLGDAAKQLRERIRLAFVELIPPEQWEAMVKAELEKFTKPQANGRDGYNRPIERPSVFAEVASEVYREHVKALFKAGLAKPEWNTQWDGVRHVAAPMIHKWLTENSDALLATMLKEMFSGVAQSMVDRLRHG